MCDAKKLRVWGLCFTVVLAMLILVLSVPVLAVDDTISNEDLILEHISNSIDDKFNEYQSNTNNQISAAMEPDKLSNTFLDTVTNMLTQTVSQSLASVFDPILSASLSFMLKIEEPTSAFSLGNVLSTETISQVYNVVYLLSCALALIKLLSKGFQVYILWRDGDPETSPVNMVIGMFTGIVMMLAFPVLYDIMADVTTWFANTIITVLHMNNQVTVVQSILMFIAAAGGGLVNAILMLIWIIMMIILFVKMVGRGVELLVLRLGVPIACLGLIDSDGGLFKGYMQIFFKTMATSVVQICLMSFSFAVVSDVGIFNLLVGISIVSTAFATPIIMQSLMVQSRPGGAFGQKINSTGMAVNTLRGLLGK